jgi:CBS domain-containing protein
MSKHPSRPFCQLPDNEGGQAMMLQEVLSSKGSTVHAIGPEAGLRDVAKKLIRHNVGALLVMEEEGSQLSEHVRGIISERDLLHAYAADCRNIDNLRVHNVMTTEVLFVSPSDEVEDVMELMTQQRIRHLPVVDDGRLLGIVSIGDMVKAQHACLVLENQFMKDYING